jgi:plasmid stabilization system protein ParE
LAATQYYLDHASPLVAAAFVAEVETAIQTLLGSPTTWAVIAEPEIRRYLLKQFPYSIYYRWDPDQDRVAIYAVMHFSRRPGGWHERLG